MESNNTDRSYEIIQEISKDQAMNKIRVNSNPQFDISGAFCGSCGGDVNQSPRPGCSHKTVHRHHHWTIGQPITTGNIQTISGTGYLKSEPTILDLAMALKECFEKSGGDVPTEPLQKLIDAYEIRMLPLPSEVTTLERRLDEAIKLLKRVREAEQVEVEWDKDAEEFLKEIDNETA